MAEPACAFDMLMMYVREQDGKDARITADLCAFNRLPPAAREAVNDHPLRLWSPSVAAAIRKFGLDATLDALRQAAADA